MKDTTSPPHEILVVGAGMAAHRFVERLLRDPGAAVRVTVIGDEGHGPYDRSALVGVLTGREVEDLQLDRTVFRDDRVRLIRDDRVLRIDRSARVVRTRSRRSYSYDVLVLATGSFAGRVAVSGARLPGCFVLRTIEDAESVRDFVDSRSRALGRPLRGVVIGGGQHGIDTVAALDDAGVGATIVQYADRLLPSLLDEAAADVLRSALEERGIAVRTRTRTTRLDPDDSGAVTALEFQDGTFQRADLVVFTVGVRPRDELARNAGLDVHPQGGVIVDDRCTTSDPRILAIGEAACVDGRCVDAAASAYAMAEVAAARLLGGGERFGGHRRDVHRTIAGVDLACFGEPATRDADPDAVEVVTHRSRGTGVYRKLLLADDAQTLLGGILMGDTSGLGVLRRLVGGPARGELAAELRRAAHPDDSRAVCVHIGMSSQELLAVLRADEVFTFSAVGARFGRDPECERCTLAVARALAELATERSPLSTRGAQEGLDSHTGPVRSEGSRVRLSTVTGTELTPGHLVDIGRLAQDLGLTLRIVDSRIELQGVSHDQQARLRHGLTAAGLASSPPLPDGADPNSASPTRRAHGAVSADPSSSESPHRGDGTTVAIGWRDRDRSADPRRGVSLRAENPA